MEKLWGGVFSSEGPEFEFRSFLDSFSFDRRIAREDYDITLVHAWALKKIGKITAEGLKKILSKREEILQKISALKGDEFEDVHSAIEFFISKEVGKDVGFNLRLGRSRNDEVITALYLWVLRSSQRMCEYIDKLGKSMNFSAEKNFGFIIPFFTHTRQAQPVLLSHLILSYIESFLRNIERFQNVLERFDVCHLGSGAGVGTSVPLDVRKMASILGFSKISQNSIDSTGRRDVIAELLFVFSSLSILFSKVAEDLIFLSAEGNDFVHLDERICTGSSMMPQKKNPDTLELIRGKASFFTGALISLLMLEKGLLSGYSKDLQEDKKILFLVWDEIEKLLIAMKHVFENFCGIDRSENRIRFYTLATDIAEKIALLGEMSYREAHRKVGEFIKERENLEANDELAIAEFFKALGVGVKEGTKGKIKVKEQVKEIFRSSLRTKRTPQSTNPKYVMSMIRTTQKRLEKMIGDLRKFLARFSEENFIERLNENIRD